MAANDAALLALVRAIVDGDRTTVSALLEASPSVATAAAQRGATRQQAEDFFLDAIQHYVYAGDTALHMAAAAYRAEMLGALITAGADVGARNRRGAQPLHYAVDGGPGAITWNPPAQAATVTALLAAGADPNAVDKNGTTPLHRAIRNRCASAVGALLAGGADVSRVNKSGSTALQLATWATGRGGSGTDEAKAQQ